MTSKMFRVSYLFKRQTCEKCLVFVTISFQLRQLFAPSRSFEVSSTVDLQLQRIAQIYNDDDHVS